MANKLILIYLCLLILAGCTAAEPTVTPFIEKTPEADEVAAGPAATSTSVPTRPAPTSTATSLPPTHTPTPETPTETPEPTATPTPEVPFGDTRIIMSPGTHNWESGFIDPGAMIVHEGQFHMFYNGISAWPAQVGVGHAVSTDGIRWERLAEEPVFSGEGLSYVGSSIFVTDVEIADDGTWMLYFYTLNASSFSGPGVIGRATATDPAGPFIADPEPILRPGPEGSWDDFAVLNPNVMRTADGYRMYYDGSRGDSERTRDRKIGLATSADGAAWTKYNIESTTAEIVAESDPIFSTGPSQSWDRYRVLKPNVVLTDTGWVMLYVSTRANPDIQQQDYYIGYAISEDGLEWSRPEENQLFRAYDRGWFAFYLLTLLHIEDTFWLYFDIQTTLTGPTNVYLSTYTGSLPPDTGE